MDREGAKGQKDIRCVYTRGKRDFVVMAMFYILPINANTPVVI